MKEKVMSLAQGKFTYEQPEIVLSPESLEFEVAEGSEASAVFCVKNSIGTKIKGFGAASEFDIEFLPVFDGKENEIEVKVHAGNRKPGDVLTGSIWLITDCGEKELPYRITVVGKYLKTVSGVITSYQEFVSYAREQFDEAVKFFYQDKFKKLYLTQMDEKRLYQNLTQKNPKKQALEEFLVAHGDKKPVQFMVNKKQLVFQVDKDVDGEILVVKDSWGMVGIRVSSDRPYVSLDKSFLYVGDFEENQAKVSFHIDAAQIPVGIHKCRIVLENVYQTLEVMIRIHVTRGMNERKKRREQKKLTAQLVQGHLQYMLNSSLKDTWLHLLQEKKEKLVEMAPEREKLLSGYISYLAQDERGMNAFLHITKEMKAPENGSDAEDVCDYLSSMYVKVKINQADEEKEALLSQIKKYYESGYRHWRLLVLLERLGYYEGNAEGLMEELDLLWDEGYASPYMHLFRNLLMLQEPDLLKQLDGKTLGALRFGLKHDLITEDIVIAVSFLSARKKKCTPVLLSLLERCYDMYENKDTLHSICALLIRSEKQGPRYFKWFRLGAQHSLRITELFEYYMYSMEPSQFDEALSSVISYFQYENHLRDSVKTSFYASIVRNREEHPEYFQVYRNVIREFTLNQLYSHRISKELAELYEAFLVKENVKDRVAKELPYVLFSHRIRCTNKNMEMVVVMHDEGGGEMRYHLTNGEAYVHIGTPNYKLYFVDKSGFYHAQKNVAFQKEKMLNLDFLAECCYENGSDYPVVLLHLFSEAQKKKETDAKDAIIIHTMVRNDMLGVEYHNKALLALYEYYRSIGEDLLLEEILGQIQFKYLGAAKQSGVLQTMIQHKMNDMALERLRKYRVLNCSKKLLLLLITWKLEENQGKFEPYYMRLCDFLFRHGVKNQTTLSYLTNYYMGCTGHLYEIYCEAQKKETEVSDGGMERLLGQALFVSEPPEKYMGLFLEYYEYGANRILVKAFLGYVAYQYLVEKCEMPEEIVEKVRKEGLSEENHIMVLAMLKYYSGKDEYTDAEKEYIRYHLSRYASTGRIFRFMKEFAGKVEVPFEISHADIIQFYCSHKGDVYIEIQDEQGGKTTHPMRQVFADVYIYETLLFRGDHLNYQIYAGDMETPVSRGELVKEAPEERMGHAFYELVNQMIAARDNGDRQTYEELVKQYKARQHMAEKLFTALS